MSRFSNERIDKHIRSAVSQMTPNQADQLWEQPVEQAKSSDWFLDGTAPKHRSLGRMQKTVSALAACFLICIVSLVAFYMQSDAAIYLDVNPSIELRINRFNRVVSAQADNADGELVLDDMSLKHTDLDVALNAILGSMVKHGYLSDNSGTILVSVECSNQERADKLSLEVSGHVEENVDTLIHSGTILSQQIHSDDTLKELSKKYGITQGKAALLQKLVSEYAQIDYDDLADLSMSELLEVLEEEKIDISDHVNFFEDDPDDLDDLDDLDDPDDIEDDNVDEYANITEDSDEDDDEPDEDEESDEDDQEEDD